MRQRKPLEECDTVMLSKILTNILGATIANCRPDKEITFMQGDILRTLNKSQEEEIHPVDLEKEHRVSRQTILGILKRLEEKNLICFEESSRGKKYKRIAITNEGRKLTEESEAEFEKIKKAIFSHVSPEEEEIANKVLIQMIQNLKGYNTDD